MCCGNTCTKYLMFLFNFVFAMGGLAILVVGALTQAQINEVQSFLDGKFSAPPIVLIVLGSIIFVIAFFGCCGAIRDSPCMLITFAICLLFILLAGIAIAIVAFVFRDHLTDEMTSNLVHAVNNYKNNDATAAEQVNAIQKALRCCGANFPADYGTPELPPQSWVLPDSCCDNYTPGECRMNTSSLYHTGCIAKLKEFIRFSGALLGGLALGVALIMIIGVVLSLGLVRAIKRSVSGTL